MEENDDGTYTEFDADGTPLGTWSFDEDSNSWVFEGTPLGSLKVNPQSGYVENLARNALMAGIAAAYVTVIVFIEHMKRKRKLNIG